MFLFIIYKYIFIKDRLFSADFFFLHQNILVSSWLHVRIRVEGVGAACNFFFLILLFLLFIFFKVKKG